MDFLRSLVLRSLGEAGAVEPPRIPYVSVHPDGVREDEGATEPETVTPPPETRAPAPERSPRVEGPETSRQVGVPHDDSPEPPIIERTIAPPHSAIDATTPRKPPETPHATVEQPTGTVPPPAPPVTEHSEPRPEPPVQRQETVRTTHETTRVHEIQRVQHFKDRIVEREIVRPTTEHEPAPPVKPEQTLTPQIQPRPKPDMAAEIPARITPPETTEPPAPPPAIHVSIGRVTVAVQAPARPSGAPARVRPAPPTMDLDEYNARVRKPR